MRWQVNRLGSRPYEFHPVKSVPLFDSKESAQPTIRRLESKSAKRSKYGPAQYVARPVPGPGQSMESFDQEFLNMVEVHRQRLETDPAYAAQFK